MRGSAIIRGLLAMLLVACAGPDESAAADPLAAILSADDHHLEQHPDRDCRVDWRPEELAVSDAERAPTGDAVVAMARPYEGTSYDYGGVGEDGLDCSGFVNRVFATLGYDLPRTARAQFGVGVKVAREDVLPGDLVFFTRRVGGSRINHVGIYLGDGRFIHASSGRNSVVVDPLALRYYDRRWAGARRITSMPPGRYSSADGGARDDVLFDSDARARAHFTRRVAPCRETEYSGLTSD